MSESPSERRSSILSASDINAIVCAINAEKFVCPINTDELKEAITFYRNVNEFFDTTKKTIWKTFVVSLVTSILGLIGLGIWSKGGH